MTSTNTEGKKPLVTIPMRRRTRLSKDGRKVSLANFVSWGCSILEHLSGEGKNALRANKVKFIIDSDTENDSQPILASIDSSV